MDANPVCVACKGPTRWITTERRFYSKEHLYVCEDAQCTGPPVRTHEQRRAKKRTLAYAIVLFVAASVDVDRILGVAPGALSDALKALPFVFLLAGVYFVYEYFAKRNGAGFRRSHAESRPATPLEKENYEELVRHSSSPQFTVKRTQVFTAAILTPRQYRRRVTETYEIGNRTLRKRTLIEARIPIGMLDKEPGTDTFAPIYFPVLTPRKGKLQDNFGLVAAGGETLHCLSYREYLILTARTVRLLTAYTEGKNNATQLSPKAEEVARTAVLLVAARLHHGATVGDLGVPPDWLDRYRVDETDRNVATAKQSLRALVNVLHQGYAIVAVVRPDDFGRIMVRVEQDVIPSLKLNWRARVKITVGARPVDLSVGLEQASTCDSYHLRINSSADLYLSDQQLEGCTATFAKNTGAVPPHYRLRPRHGQSYAHFYSRYFPVPEPRENPRLHVKFFERPPGSTLPAAASAFITFVLVWVVALVTKAEPDPASDAPAWLLAFPALAAAWLGVEAPSDRLLEGTFAARISLATTIATCIAAAVAFMAHNVYRAGKNFEWWTLPGGWTVFWIADVLWLIIFAVATTNAAGTIYSYLRRTAYYEYLSSRGKDSEVQEHA